MPIPIAEAKKFPTPVATDWPKMQAARDVSEEPPDFHGKERVVGFLARSRGDAFELEELLQRVLPKEFIEFNQRTGTYYRWLRELADTGRVCARKMYEKIYLYVEGQ